MLGVARNAPVDEIRRAYVALARRTHPDVAGDDPQTAEQMRRINLAWEMLSDADERAAVDRRLAPRPQSSPRPTPPARPEAASNEAASNEADDNDGDGDYDFGHEDFDGDDRPLSAGELPAFMRAGAPLAFVVGIFAVIFGVLAGGFVLVRLGVMLIGLSALLFMLSPFVVLIRSRGGPRR